MIHQITNDFISIINYIIPVITLLFALRTSHYCYLAREHTKELHMLAVYSFLYIQLHYFYMGVDSQIRLPVVYEMSWRAFHMLVFIYFISRTTELARAANKKIRTFIKTPIDSNN